MIPPIFFDAIVFSSMLSLLSTSLTLAYVTTKLPNFTQGSLVTIGVYTSLTGAKLWNLNPYWATVPAFMIGGIVAVLIYRLCLRSQIRRHVTTTFLMVTTLAVWVFLTGGINMYADYLQFSLNIPSRGFLLANYDFSVSGEPGILVFSTALSAVLIVALFILLNKTDFGIALRAATENSYLAENLGINIDGVNLFSWFVSGGLSALAGAVVPLWFYSTTTVGDTLLISMFAASTLGGLTSIFGAILGGYLIGLSQILGTSYLAYGIGPWVVAYQFAIPLVIMCLVLLLMPNGLGTMKWQRIFHGRRSGN